MHLSRICLCFLSSEKYTEKFLPLIFERKSRIPSSSSFRLRHGGMPGRYFFLPFPGKTEAEMH